MLSFAARAFPEPRLAASAVPHAVLYSCASYVPAAHHVFEEIPQRSQIDYFVDESFIVVPDAAPESWFCATVATAQSSPDDHLLPLLLATSPAEDPVVSMSDSDVSQPLV